MKIFGKTLTLKDALAGFGVISILLAIPLTVVLTQQNNQLESHAAYSEASYFVSSTPPCRWTFSISGVTKTSKYGDVNRDGYVTSADAQLILQWSANPTTFPTDRWIIEAGDVSDTSVKRLSSTSNVTSVDSNLILNYVARKTSSFSACGGRSGAL